MNMPIIEGSGNNLINNRDKEHSTSVELAPTKAQAFSGSLLLEKYTNADSDSASSGIGNTIQQPYLDGHQLNYDSRLSSTRPASSESPDKSDQVLNGTSQRELKSNTSLNSRVSTCDTVSKDDIQCQREPPERSSSFFDNPIQEKAKLFDVNEDERLDDDEDDDELFDQQLSGANRLRAHDRSSPFYLSRQNNPFGQRVLNRIKLFSKHSATNLDFQSLHTYEDRDLLTGGSKYRHPRRKYTQFRKTFRGSYKYSRSEISMAVFKKCLNLMFQRSTLALFGAFLIHITLGTVYTLSNINSYLISYMRKHGSPHATYGASMWLSSLFAVGQGLSMVLGGYIEKKFSARVSCIIGCSLHSLSIMSTSWSLDHGVLAVLVTYGLIPGFGCGLSYMTPMSNGFGWFPNRKGLVAGTILAGFGIGTFVFNMAQTAFVNPENLSPPEDANGYFIQSSVLSKVPSLFIFMGSIYAAMQFVGCCLLFKPPIASNGNKGSDEQPILVEPEPLLSLAIKRREFIVLFLVYGIITQGVLFVNSMIKEYGQIFIGDDMYLAWTGSMSSITNAVGRLAWGLAIDRYSFTQCFTAITLIFGTIMFLMPFEFILSSKLLYLIATLGLFGSFSGWMSTFPVHISRVFGRTNSGMIYGLIFVSQSIGGIGTALGAHYLIDHYSRFVPFFCVVVLEIIGLAIYHIFYPK